ncbi:PREDICTED: uncharacterized protein LOC109173934 [Ipomoea nil]|uniref:uncharacterized protein LOC109173934 n=1 Tax=Ipomoea nil TaxID=35883 RepID=UPI000900AEF5|nr:PREDICTED: uncharacterized protein LOC109173934 [Ipomoea nil]
MSVTSPGDPGDNPDDASSSTENPAYGVWVQQDASILSLLISSLSEEVMYLALGQATSLGVWMAAETALGSATQFHRGVPGPCATFGRGLALAGRTLTPTEQNLYVFRGLRPEFQAIASSMAITGRPVSIPQLADYLQAQQFIDADDFPTYQPATQNGGPAALYAGRGRRQHGDSGRQSHGGGGRDGNQRGGRGGRGQNGGLHCQICRSQGHSAAFCYRRYTEPLPSQAHVAVAGDGTA